jgi:hypothetical protein
LSPSISVNRYLFKLVSVVESLLSISCLPDMGELDRQVDGETWEVEWSDINQAVKIFYN